VTGGSKESPWQADTYFEVEHRQIVIELQRSYQHLNDYLRRQERYVHAGIESYWLVRLENSSGLMGALRKFRIKRDFGGRLPNGVGIFPFIQELPVVILQTGDFPIVSGAKLFKSSLKDWLGAIVERRFRWDDGAWLIA
jgi:competence protein CoiA